MIFLGITCAILLLCLCFSIFINFKLAKVVVETEDALEESLDVCDSAYNKISQILDMPVAIATPEVKYIVTEIKAVRDSILYVSNLLAEPYGGVVEEKDEDVQV